MENKETLWFEDEQLNMKKLVITEIVPKNKKQKAPYFKAEIGCVHGSDAYTTRSIFNIQDCDEGRLFLEKLNALFEETDKLSNRIDIELVVDQFIAQYQHEENEPDWIDIELGDLIHQDGTYNGNLICRPDYLYVLYFDKDGKKKDVTFE